MAQELTRDQSRKNKECHFVNLNADPMLSGVVFHFIDRDRITFGRKDAKPCPQICFSGLWYVLKSI